MTIVDAKVPWDREARLAQDGLAFPRDEYEARVEKVRLGMQEAGLSHLIAYGNYADPGNITYLSGFFTRHGDSFVVVPLEGEPTLLTNWVMHDEPMHSEIWTTWLDDVRPCPPFTYDVVDELVAAVKAGGRVGRVGFAGGRVGPAPVVRALESGLDVELAPADGLMAVARRVKSPLEIALMRRASELAGVSIAHDDGDVRAGRDRARGGGRRPRGDVRGRGRLPRVRAGALERTPRRPQALRARPGARSRRADLVFIDTGAVVSGYYSDVSRSVAVGEPTAEGRRLLAAGEVLYAELVEARRPGTGRSRTCIGTRSGSPPTSATRTSTCRAASGTASAACCSSRRACATSTSEDVLEPGMTFAFEPMIIVDGLGTACVEDVMLVTETGIEPLSGLPTALYS